MDLNTKKVRVFGSGITLQPSLIFHSKAKGITTLSRTTISRITV